MHRVALAICLSMSLAAGTLGVVALSESRSVQEDEALLREDRSDQLEDALTALQKELKSLRGQHERLQSHLKAERSRREELEKRVSASEAADSVDEADAAALEAEVAALPLTKQLRKIRRRIAFLENGENIVDLVSEGHERKKERVFEDASDLLLDPRADLGERIAAFERLHGAGRHQEHDVATMIDLAHNLDLDAETRADVLRKLDGVRMKSVVQPMLDLVQHDSDPEVRKQALDVLQQHGDEPVVLETFERIAKSDPHEIVQARAQRDLASVQRMANGEPLSVDAIHFDTNVRGALLRSFQVETGFGEQLLENPEG